MKNSHGVEDGQNSHTYIRKDRFKGAELDGRLWLNIEINRFRQLAVNVTAALVECATRLTISESSAVNADRSASSTSSVS